MFNVHKIISKNLTAMRSFFRRVNQIRTNMCLLGDEPGLQDRRELASSLCAEKERSLWRSNLQESGAGPLAQPQAGTVVLSTTGCHCSLSHQLSRRCRGHTATLFGDPQISTADKSFLLPGNHHRSKGPNTNSINGTHTYT